MKAVPLFVHTRWAQVRDIPRNNTDDIRFRRYTLLTAATTALTEGVTPSGSQLAITNVNATVLQYGDYVTLTDKLLFTTLDPVLTETAELLGIQYGDTIDQLTRNILRAGTTIQYAGSATARDEVTSAMKITKAEIQEAVRTLKTNNARRITSQVDPSTGFNTSPLSACYIGIVHPGTTYDLKNIPGFIRVEEYGQKKAMEGEVGTLDEVRFVETTNASVFSSAGSGSIDVYGTLILGTEAYGISRISGEAVKNIVKPLGSAGSADPLDQRQTSGWKATHVAKILNESFLLRLEHAVSS
jgi:N4-gp56 family major capsid protein